jgi:hypothetical protein
MATFWVSGSGNDSWGGGWLCPLRTVREAVSRAGAWAADHPGQDVQIRLRAGIFPVNELLTVTFPRLSIRGAGIGKTILLGSGDGQWQIRVNGGHRFGLSHLTLHTDTEATDASSLWIEASDEVFVHHVHVTEIRFWGIVLGTTDACLTGPVNARARFEDCVFDQSNPDSTTEALLVFNTRDVAVTRCTFLGIPCDGIGLGLFQAVTTARVTTCGFFGTGRGAYYPISGADLQFTDCEFRTANGLVGANQSDNGALGSTHAEGLTVQGCRFTSQNDGKGLQIGAVHTVLVSSCIFENCIAIAIVIDRGNDVVPHPGLVFNCPGDTPLPLPTRQIQVLNNIFENNNPLGTYPKIHPDILVQLLPPGHPLDLVIAGNTFTSPLASHYCLTLIDEVGEDGTYANLQFDPAANTFSLAPGAVIVSGTVL